MSPLTHIVHYPKVTDISRRRSATDRKVTTAALARVATAVHQATTLKVSEDDAGESVRLEEALVVAAGAARGLLVTLSSHKDHTASVGRVKELSRRG
jgi:hypothetical protein